MAKKHCSHCGAAMVEYKRAFSKDMAICMYRIAKAGGVEVDVSKLTLTHPQYSNFQRLRFWGLVEKVMVEGDHGKGGCWSVTEKGWEFVNGKIEIPKYVFTYRGEPVEFSENCVAIQDVAEDWWYKPRVVDESRIHLQQTSMQV